MKQVKYNKKIKETILSKKWEFGYERRMTYTRIRGFNYAHWYQFPKTFGVNLKYEVFRIKEGATSLYRESTENVEALSVIEDKLLHPIYKNFISNLTSITQSYFDEFKFFIQKSTTKYKSYTNKELLSAYKEFIKIDNKISLPNRLIFTQFEDVLTNAIKKIIFEKDEDAEKVLETLSCPYITIPLDIYSKDLLKISISPVSKREGLLDKFYKKYIHWGMFDWNYNVLDKIYHENKLSELDVVISKKSENDVKSKYRKQKIKNEAILKKYSDNKHLYDLLTLYLTSANIKEWKNYYREQSSYKLKFLMQEIANRFDITLEQIAFMTENEIFSLFLKNVALNREGFDQRFKNSAFIFIKDSLTIVTNEDDLAILDKQLNTSLETEVKGKVVFSGIVQGIARIILSDKDFHKLNKGDILITGTTRPSYIPIMEKAAAFVTNEGGLLSHAAIIAREMKKPCIVGTKIATKVLKDGDMVEVDAEKGIVKIIKKA